MDKIVVLILTIAVTLCLFSFSVMEEASSAKEVMSLVDSEQNEIEYLLRHPDLVTADYVLDYLNRYPNTEVFSVSTTITVKEIPNYKYFEMRKTYETNGDTTISFHTVTDPYARP